ncbi:unnamed protein product [Lathyrus oleraceus]|uniref:Albumin-1 A n=1 Tax=Pisum sativum TaxID=3888 RepID=ALB1A_PEA|nr:RecName: Full=Albumin-1 A; AltName: Full=PA1 A; Contains: RecName: Full=Albumin-1 A chain b; AltName: Full=Leginsulin A; AltName: Full=PA1b A; Contains: RecName: Full=Albumin-1 A chain a; AltName: Full=PA1a A; Flags: Precursor [Pisum sativum]AAA33638.1 albumin 1 [Pisum sativum]
MASVKLASLIVLFATLGMFLTKNVGAASCNGVCSPFEMPPCGTSACRCIPVGLVVGYCRNPSGVFLRTNDEHPNLCESDADCRKKGSGNFCGHYPNPDIEYGWCFASKSEAEDFFSKITPKDLLKSVSTA